MRVYISIRVTLLQTVIACFVATHEKNLQVQVLAWYRGMPDDQIQVRGAGKVADHGMPHCCWLVSTDNVIVHAAVLSSFHAAQQPTSAEQP